MDVYSIIENHTRDEININDYVFLIGCEVGNIELIEWMLNDIDIDVNIANNLPFLLACENNQLEVAKYLYKRNPNMSFRNTHFITHIFNQNYFELIKWIHQVMPDLFNFLTIQELYTIFEEVLSDHLEMAEWMISVFPHIPIYNSNNRLFINACKLNDIDVAKLLVNSRPSCYYISIVDNQIVHFDIISILNIKKKRKVLSTEACYICYENKSNILTSCKHFYCLNCIETHYAVNNHLCPYCRKENDENDLSIIV